MEFNMSSVCVTPLFCSTGGNGPCEHTVTVQRLCMVYSMQLSSSLQYCTSLMPTPFLLPCSWPPCPCQRTNLLRLDYHTARVIATEDTCLHKGQTRDRPCTFRPCSAQAMRPPNVLLQSAACAAVHTDASPDEREIVVPAI